MNHFDEMACLLYLEGQLDAARARELAVHAGECAPCRSLLRALEHESQLLAGALTEENESLPARLLGAREWTWPSWVWTLVFGTFAAAAYWIWTDGISPWLNQLTKAGFAGTDVMSMVLFSGAFWEGWDNLVDIIQIAIVLLLVIGALGLLRRRFGRTSAMAVVLVLIACGMALPQTAGAAEMRRGRAVTVPAGETVHNDLIITSPLVRIEGTVDGDVIAFTRNLTVTGHVTGDVIALAGQAEVDGTVDGNVRIVSENGTLQGVIGKNVSAIGGSLTLGPKGTVGGGVIALAGHADLDGKIHRDLLGLVGESELDGIIGGETWIRGGSLAVASTAEIDGPVTFLGREQPTVASGAKLASPIRVEITQERARTRRSAAARVVRAVFRYAAALVVGILLLTILPGFFQAVLRAVGSIGLPVGVGALACITGFFLLAFSVLLLFTGVGAGLAGMMLYAPILYLSQIVVGAWAGNKILGEAAGNMGAAIGHMALGLLIIHVAGAIPVLGALVWIVVLLLGTGAVLLGFYRMARQESTVAPA